MAFQYHSEWINRPSARATSLSLPLFSPLYVRAHVGPHGQGSPSGS
ncbi:hypothetical protein [Onishia taeanensis]